MLAAVLPTTNPIVSSSSQEQARWWLPYYTKWAMENDHSQPLTGKQALNILHMAIEPILAHGAVLDKGRAMFLVAKCQVASAASYSPQKKTEALESAILNLNEAKTYFGMVDCKEQIRDILYLQARLYNSLGRVQERNKCSMLFRQIHQELPSHGVSLLLRL
ncbi:hypothetical protein AB205_0167090 [Aquarana catesbeiana]|uniref:Cohesin loading complex subunit SCC4 homolog n=1 Tax=Aquarana catesbeiana TaxID=8400 RepID=A0A2G9SH70_AQUCT|nr:hypothetical protein AB205_0167090 [Aquarana catesbeiana]